MASLLTIAHLFPKREENTFAHPPIDNPWECGQNDQYSHGRLTTSQECKKVLRKLDSVRCVGHQILLKLVCRHNKPEFPATQTCLAILSEQQTTTTVAEGPGRMPERGQGGGRLRPGDTSGGMCPGPSAGRGTQCRTRQKDCYGNCAPPMRPAITSARLARYPELGSFSKYLGRGNMTARRAAS